MKTYAFDIYGTLIDPMALGEVLKGMIGAQAAEFNNLAALLFLVTDHFIVTDFIYRNGQGAAPMIHHAFIVSEIARRFQNIVTEIVCASIA